MIIIKPHKKWMIKEGKRGYERERKREEEQEKEERVICLFIYEFFYV